MIVGLFRKFQCDHQYCLRKTMVKTGSMAYGTNDSLERETLRRRGWFVCGLSLYCPTHKKEHGAK